MAASPVKMNASPPQQNYREPPPGQYREAAPAQPHFGEQGRRLGPPGVSPDAPWGATAAHGVNSDVLGDVGPGRPAVGMAVAQPHYGDAGRRVGPLEPSAAAPWAPPSNGGPHGVRIDTDVPLGSSDDALDGFIGAADLDSPAKDFGAPERSESAMDGGGWSAQKAAALRLQGQFGAAGPQDLPPRE